MFIFNEDPSEYRKENRFYIEQLIGEKETEKLYLYFESEHSVLHATEKEYLMAGITKKSAGLITAAKSIQPVVLDVKIKSSVDCYNLVKYLGNYNEEHFVIVPLNRQHQVISKPVTISIGGLSGTVVDTKILFSKLLVHKRMNGFICAHNHPSNNIQPSSSDIELTDKIKGCSKLLDISFLDHLIVTQNGYYSFADNGQL